ncbi:DUF3885 domain-containing protein [Oleomonas cavernae]|uniref:DUF3885 domain-containing protein n=1 Tax=Oleomonas cavernae TaxID=2320859 RepID=A0A418WCC5_9PROT|nr:DUF3885 domain-containing protein [Oleomonas cavernae]RJF87697.1 DUF3885 domain-containing protein [Oleomonas cavernae]
MPGNTTIAEIAGLFGKPELSHALFYAFEVGLRLRLGSDQDWHYQIDRIPRFLHSIDRARAIIRAVFAPTDPVALISQYGGPAWGNAERKGIAALKAAGFDVGVLKPAGDVIQDDHDDGTYRRWYLTPPLPAHEVDKLTWCAVSGEIDVKPQASAFKIYLVDPDRKVIAHVYDDRGMDVVALEPDTLRPLYRQFQGWLLDYDRSRMDAVFASGNVLPVTPKTTD